MVPFCHLGIVSYRALKHDTMEGFCVWWNTGTLADILALNREFGPYLNDPSLATRGLGGVQFAHDIQTLRLFLRKRMALAWAFICIMDEVAKQGVLHNDLSPSNIVFHVQSDKTLRIGICDWGSAARAREEPRSIFGLWSREEEQRMKRERWWVHRSLFHLRGNLHMLLDGTIPPSHHLQLTLTLL